MLEEVILYLLLINVIGFLMMVIDKRKAIKKKWRISENTFIITAIIGGSIGILFGMYTVRHKTKHIKFTVGIPLIIIAQLIVTYLYFLY